MCVVNVGWQRNVAERMWGRVGGRGSGIGR